MAAGWASVALTTRPRSCSTLEFLSAAGGVGGRQPEPATNSSAAVEDLVKRPTRVSTARIESNPSDAPREMLSNFHRQTKCVGVLLVRADAADHTSGRRGRHGGRANLAHFSLRSPMGSLVCFHVNR